MDEKTYLVIAVTIVAVVAARLALLVIFAGGDLQRVRLALAASWRVLRDAAFAEKVKALLAPPPPPEPKKPSGAPLWLLTILQREGRLVDFLLEDIKGVPDAQIGAGVRDIHAKCQKALKDHLVLGGVLTGTEGDAVEVPKDFDPSAIRLTGNVTGEPPFRGTLKHPGWRVKELNLTGRPSLTLRVGVEAAENTHLAPQSVMILPCAPSAVARIFPDEVVMSEPSPKPQSGADILVQCLVNHGVEVIFAYPGGASMPLHQALTRYQRQLRTILPRHEQGGGFAAQGYARATGKVGVCMATSGPGATNLVTCLADAKMDSVPLLAITGQVGTHVIGTDAFQETPIVEICRPITKHHYLVTRTEDIARVMKEAFHVATTGRPGPVIVDLPKDVQNRCIVPDYDPPMNLPGYRPLTAATREQLLAVLDMVRKSKKPIIYAGGGVVAAEASAALKTFAERTGIPVALTVHGLGAFPCEHFLCLQMLGMHGTVYANYAINDADLLLAFGVRFDDRVTGKVSEFAKHGKIVHIDIDPSEINKIKAAHVPIVADLAQALPALVKLLDEPAAADVQRGGRLAEWIGQVEAWRSAEPLHFQDRDDAIVAQYAIERLWQIVRDRGRLDDTIVTTGVGQHQMWAAQFFKFNTPRSWFTSGGLGSMGFGLPAALGAQAAHPLKTVIDIDGDGSFLMNVQELACAYTENLPVKVLLLNNQHLGMVMQWEDRFYESNRAHTYLGAGFDKAPYPDFVTMVKGFKCGAATVEHKEDYDAAVAEMLDSKLPYVLNVMVPYQEHVLPMIPGGMTVRDIIKA
jgi:acetolactate synthase-1/2/3 large subunit